jgi:muconate cycloisomerase
MPTTIQSIETFPVIYPVEGRFKFFESPAGRPMGRPAVVIKITADDGTVGWGESAPSQRWSYETIESVHSTIEKYLTPELLGADPFDAEGVHAKMNLAIAGSFSTGQPICKCGIDLALFDLTGKILNQSAAQRWGRNDEQTVTLSWTLNPRTLDDAEADIAKAHDRGYRHFNIKVAPDPAYDLELCALARRMAPDAVIWCDANGGYDLRSALEVAPRLADLGILALEQPVPSNRLSWFREVRQQAALPILMDEGIVSLAELEEFHQLKLMDGVAIKVTRCGGLTEARRHVEFLENNGLMFLASGLTDPDLSLSASLALFGAYGLKYPAALNGPQFLAESLLTEPLQIDGDVARVSDGPGLGVNVSEAKIEKIRVEL